MLRFYSLFLFIFITGCFKQSPDNSHLENKYSPEKEKRLKACEQVQFEKTVFTNENLKQFFICSQWDQKLPHMYQNLETKSPWTKLLNSINNWFASTNEKKSFFSSQVLKLEEDNNIVVLTDSVRKLLDKDLLKDLLSKIERWDRDHEKPLWNALSLLPTQTQNISLYLKTLKALHVASQNQIDNFSVLHQSYKDNSDYIQLRRLFINQFAKSLLAGPKEDILFFSSLLNSSNENTQNHLLFDLFNYTSENQITDFFKFPTIESPKILNKLRLLKKTLPIYPCQINGSHRFQLSTSNIFKLFARDLATLEYEDFVQSMIDLYSQATFAHEACDLEFLTIAGQELHLPTIFKDVHQFLDNPFAFHLMSLSFQVSFEEITGLQEQYILDFMTGDFYQSFNELNLFLLKNDKEKVFHYFLSTLQSLQKDDFKLIAASLKVFFQESHIEAIQQIATFWLSLEARTQEKILSFFDSLISGPSSAHQVIDFIISVAESFPDEISYLKENFWKTDELKRKTLNLITENLELLSIASVNNDFNVFFTKEYLSNLLLLFAKGTVLNQEDVVSIPIDNAQPIQPESILEDHLLVSKDFLLNESSKVKELNQCLKELLNMEMGLSPYFSKLSHSCDKVDFKQPFFTLTKELKHLSRLIPKSDFSSKGLLKPELLATVLDILRSLNTSGSLPLDANIFIYKINSILFSGQNSLEKPLDTFFKAVLSMPEKHIVNFLKLANNLSSQDFEIFLSEWIFILEEYNHYVPQQLQEIVFIDCESFSEPHLEGLPCQNSNNLSKDFFKILKMSTKVHHEKSLLESFLHSFQRPIDLPIAKNGQYQANINDFISFFFKLDRKKTLNYTSEHFISHNKEVSFLDFIDVMFRNGVFENNKYSAFTINEFTKTRNYKKTHAKITRYINLCLKPLTPSCGGGMIPNKNIQRLARNTKEAFNFAHHLADDPDLRNQVVFSQYLFRLIKSTSHPDAQASGYFLGIPKLPSNLQKHNVHFLSMFAKISGFKNTTRILKSFIGHNPEDLNNFLQSSDYKFFQNLLLDLDPARVSSFVTRMVNDYPKETQNIFSHLLVFMDSSSNEQKKNLFHFILNMTKLFHKQQTIKKSLFNEKLIPLFPVVLETILLNDNIISFSEKLTSFILNSQSPLALQWFEKQINLISSFFKAHPQTIETIVSKLENNPNFIPQIFKQLSLALKSEEFDISILASMLKTLKLSKQQWEPIFQLISQIDNDSSPFYEMMKVFFNKEDSWIQIKKSLSSPLVPHFINMVLFKTQ